MLGILLAGTAQTAIKQPHCYTNGQYTCFFNYLLPYHIVLIFLALAVYFWNYKKINALLVRKKIALLLLLLAAFFGGSLFIQRFFLVGLCPA